ncbi:hypothetical protein G4V62_09230 [Bacillaceae bacterium SIJ1]|nr:hypothetical protein [Litoribacterium kuwaitense]
MKVYLITLWKLMDPLYYSCTRLQLLKDTKMQSSIFRVRLTCYKGQDITLTDGTVFRKNDVLIKIHLHNAQVLHELSGMNNELRRAMILYKKVQDSLPLLASYIRQHKNAHEIKGIIGITLLNKGCERLGFESYSITSRIYKSFKQLALYPIYLLSTTNPYVLGKNAPSPKYLFMSKANLFDKYGTTAD